MSENKVYLLVRDDLKMGKGKIGAQCGHAVQGLLLSLNKEQLMSYISEIGSPKIVLKVNSLEQMETIINLCIVNKVPYYQVIDSGRTQIPSGSATVLAVGPIRDTPKEVFDIIKELKLL